MPSCAVLFPGAGSPPEYTRSIDYGVQLGRRFRALKRRFVIRAFDSDGLAERIRYHCALTSAFALWVDDAPDWDRLAPTPMSVVCFRFAPAGISEEERNAVNAAILERVNSSGRVYLSHTKLGDVYTLRLAVGSLRTERRQVAEAWGCCGGRRRRRAEPRTAPLGRPLAVHPQGRHLGRTCTSSRTGHLLSLGRTPTPLASREAPMIRRASRGSSIVSLTEARTRLFRLVEDLLTGRTDRVALSHREYDEEVLLVRARDVERMEEEIAQLRERVAPAPRPLRGLGRIVDGAELEDVLAGIRADARALSDAKLGSFATEDDPVVVPKRGARGTRKRRTGRE